MACTNVKPKPRLRLLVDKEKKKVVFAEAGRDFVDLLTLPMGLIVGLLEKHQNPKPSIVDAVAVYSDLSTTKCRRCGRLMTFEIGVEEEQMNEVFVITDDLKVALSSTGYILSVLNDLGYDGFDHLEEILIDVAFEQVVNFPWFLFTSEAPLTDSFLRKKCMTRNLRVSTPLFQERGVAGDANKVLTLKVFFRKTDNVILYAECREDFVDFLCTFLAIPLVCSWKRSTDNVNKVCVGNLFSSLRGLNFEQPGNLELPYYYSIGAQLLGLDVEDVPEYELAVNVLGHNCGKLSKKIHKDSLKGVEWIRKLKPVDSTCLGLLKGETNFIVTDDLVVTPTKLCSRILLLSKLKVRISDIEEHVISFGKSEV